MGLIVMLNLRCVDLVVLGMRPEELDEHELGWVVDGYDQPVRVPFDVEHHTLSANDASCSVSSPYVLGPRPLLRLHILEPGLERVLGVAVFGPRLFERLSSDDPHGITKPTTLPKWEPESRSPP